MKHFDAFDDSLGGLLKGHTHTQKEEESKGFVCCLAIDLSDELELIF